MRDITLCHPRLQTKAAQWIEACAKQGIKVKISETLRTVEEQDALYAQGRTKPGKIATNAKGSSYSSQHQWGIAYDFYLRMDIDGDGKVSDDSYNDSSGTFGKVAAIAKDLGLAWGGDWTSIIDKPHIYLPDWGSTTVKLKQTYGTPEAFIKTWEQSAGWVQDGIGWWYRHADGGYTTNEWELIADKWYWFNADGYAYRSQWVEVDGKWYWLDDSCAMVTGLQQIQDKFYYFGNDGAMSTKPITLTPDVSGELH